MGLGPRSNPPFFRYDHYTEHHNQSNGDGGDGSGTASENDKAEALTAICGICQDQLPAQSLLAKLLPLVLRGLLGLPDLRHRLKGDAH